MIEYSFIIPHKNAPNLLEKCLKSIPQRPDCEIIIIDDNSDRDKVDFSNFPGTDRDDVTIILSKDNKGAGHVRNLGLEKASGRWLVFADADDFFSKDLGSVLDKYAGDEHTDIVFLNACIIDDEGNTHPFIQNRLISNYVNNKTDSEDILRYQVWTPWSRMIKRSIPTSHNIKFEETRIANDAFFVLNCTSHANKINAIKNIVYYYYKPSAGSQTDMYYDEQIALFRLELKLRINSFYKKVGYKYLWPIEREIKILKLRKNKEVKSLLNTYKFSFIEDTNSTLRYFISKIIKRL